ncbi:hypothetical protein [Novosphingobium album (ex Liu et al. 2023)]|uniref:Uncharacterized protein n=1 Tax=Novosphingobium album (ex Liu et al. 2023) TaxID=3031130 RepID=A0ABT5WMQ7_9SPHN|nr:hypothetical protein [Novosphingobium album (ex Liu et al. 2023)]MDE8651164.1 hypothetical protein [Novosphingobium album (ex Liu et al. 2023)]
MRNIDFSSWQSVIATVIGLALVTLIGVGIRLVMMVTIQQRRERMNRQINERLRTLIAAYKTLGGSFTGNLAVDPTHLRDLRRRAPEAGEDAGENMAEPAAAGAEGSDRARRIRDAVEAALSDIILLGTEEQVRLAERAARELVAGRPVHTHELVVSLRDFVREALDLDPIPADLAIPTQGPARPLASGGRTKGESGKDGARQGGGGSGMGGGMGGGMGMGMGIGGGMGLGAGLGADAVDDPLPPGQQP